MTALKKLSNVLDALLQYQRYLHIFSAGIVCRFGFSNFYTALAFIIYYAALNLVVATSARVLKFVTFSVEDLLEKRLEVLFIPNLMIHAIRLFCSDSYRSHYKETIVKRADDDALMAVLREADLKFGDVEQEGGKTHYMLTRDHSFLNILSPLDHKRDLRKVADYAYSILPFQFYDAIYLKHQAMYKEFLENVKYPSPKESLEYKAKAALERAGRPHASPDGSRLFQAYARSSVYYGQALEMLQVSREAMDLGGYKRYARKSDAESKDLAVKANEATILGINNTLNTIETHYSKATSELLLFAALDRALSQERKDLQKRYSQAPPEDRVERLYFYAHCITDAHEFEQKLANFKENTEVFYRYEAQLSRENQSLMECAQRTEAFIIDTQCRFMDPDHQDAKAKRSANSRADVVRAKIAERKESAGNKDGDFKKLFSAIERDFYKMLRKASRATPCETPDAPAPTREAAVAEPTNKPSQMAPRVLHAERKRRALEACVRLKMEIQESEENKILVWRLLCIMYEAMEYSSCKMGLAFMSDADLEKITWTRHYIVHHPEITASLSFEELLTCARDVASGMEDSVTHPFEKRVRISRAVESFYGKLEAICLTSWGPTQAERELCMASKTKDLMIQDALLVRFGEALKCQISKEGYRHITHTDAEVIAYRNRSIHLESDPQGSAVELQALLEKKERRNGCSDGTRISRSIS